MDPLELKSTLQKLGINELKDLFSHLDQTTFLDEMKNKQNGHLIPLNYDDLAKHLLQLSEKNILPLSFVGDGLLHFRPSPILSEICAIRGLTTAYTPYQPERSQGTLQTLWIYQSLLAELTGMDAINASLYDRSTCLFEAIQTALRFEQSPERNNVWVFNNIYPGDKNVLETLSAHTDIKLQFIESDKNLGKFSLTSIKNAKDLPKVMVFPQINCWGNIEDVDDIVDFCVANNIITIAIIDPILIGNHCLKPPREFGSNKDGVDMMVAEGQHLGMDAMYGGPGLGIFGLKFSDKNKNALRATPGRFIGKAKDLDDKECKVIVMSTREQHIRREKATSNICSNQSFIATMIGAALLEMGSIGITNAGKSAREKCLKALEFLLRFEGINLAFPKCSFWNEVTLTIDSQYIDLNNLLKEARAKIIDLGLNISERLGDSRQLLKLSFTNIHQDEDIHKLYQFLKIHFKETKSFPLFAPIDEENFRKKTCSWNTFDRKKIITYYQELGNQNLSPDEGIYPLGSCTMKYNPYINDWAAALPGFASLHPQAHEDFAQGNLQILFEIQEYFKAITGLKGVTTQPVAGAQGEWVGLKLFQAYHADRGEGNNRRFILIPKSAHGTNPATATVAGYENKIKDDGLDWGIKLVEANELGIVNINQIKDLVKELGTSIAGIMITNPNTGGIYEVQFKEIAALIHSVGGLVYMDGANMNAIAGWVDLDKLGVDAIHNNLHKTWTIPHGGGGPGDAIVAVSEKLVPYLPGHQIIFDGAKYQMVKSQKSIGSFHRHHGNFGHKVRAYTYIKALGFEGARAMSAVSVLSSRYLLNTLEKHYPTLPANTMQVPKMHEFIITLPETTFAKCAALGLSKQIAITRVGKLFLDFGYHAPTVAFPEPLGLMIEPTESFSKTELDQFAETVLRIGKLVEDHPELLLTAPHFTPIRRVDEVTANKQLVLHEKITDEFPPIYQNKIDPKVLKTLSDSELRKKLLEEHKIILEKMKLKGLK